MLRSNAKAAGLRDNLSALRLGALYATAGGGRPPASAFRAARVLRGRDGVLVTDLPVSPVHADVAAAVSCCLVTGRIVGSFLCVCPHRSAGSVLALPDPVVALLANIVIRYIVLPFERTSASAWMIPASLLVPGRHVCGIVMLGRLPRPSQDGANVLNDPGTPSPLLHLGLIDDRGRCGVEPDQLSRVPGRLLGHVGLAGREHLAVASPDGEVELPVEGLADDDGHFGPPPLSRGPHASAVPAFDPETVTPRICRRVQWCGSTVTSSATTRRKISHNFVQLCATFPGCTRHALLSTSVILVGARPENHHRSACLVVPHGVMRVGAFVTATKSAAAAGSRRRSPAPTRPPTPDRHIARPPRRPSLGCPITIVLTESVLGLGPGP